MPLFDSPLNATYLNISEQTYDSGKEIVKFHALQEPASEKCPPTFMVSGHVFNRYSYLTITFITLLSFMPLAFSNSTRYSYVPDALPLTLVNAVCA